MVHVPSSTDQVGQIDTTGVAPGPHSKLEGVTPIFDIEKERIGHAEEDERTLAERFTEKAVAAGTEEYQERNSEVANRKGIETPYVDVDEAGQYDTSETDTVSATGVGHDVVEAEQTDQWDTSETGGGPGPDLISDGTLEDGTSLTGAEPFNATADASAEPDLDDDDEYPLVGDEEAAGDPLASTDPGDGFGNEAPVEEGTLDTTLETPDTPITADNAEAPNAVGDDQAKEALDSDGGTGDGPKVEGGSEVVGDGVSTPDPAPAEYVPNEDRVKALNKVKGGIPVLLKLAEDNKVEIEAGSQKADIVRALDAAGVDAPAAE